MEDKKEAKKDNIITRIKAHPLFLEICLAVLLIAAIAGVLIWNNINSKVSIEDAQVTAPIIALAPATPGILEKVYVSQGEQVGRHKAVALISNKTLTTQTDGIIIEVNNVPGQVVSSATPVVKMIHPEDFRVVGRIDEDKGLEYIHVGQKVKFTVDAFGSKEYDGVVDEIALSARQGDIVFSISDKRQQSQFDVKVKYDVEKYPELKNGMSAKMWVYK